MATTFKYAAQDRAGKTLDGTLDADSEAEALRTLRSQGLTPIDVQASGAGLKQDVRLPFLAKRVKRKELAVFSRQFATMVNSGLSLLRSLTILAEQTENAYFAEALGQVVRDLEGGRALSDALGAHPKIFDQLYVSMVRAGESGGVLDDVLLRLADTIEKQVALRAKVRSAASYPIMALLIIVGITAAMLVFVVPQFSSLYESLGGDLPVPTRVLIALSNLIVPWGLVSAAVLTPLALFAFRRWVATDMGRAMFDNFKLRIPIFGTIVHKSALARFARTQSALMRSGVPILEALEITAAVVNNRVLADALDDIAGSVTAG